MPLKVIGAGMGRTGTNSLKFALERLGFGPCCHMFDLISTHRDRWALWERAFDDAPVDWEEVYAGFNSAVDAPGNFFYRKLSKAYPQAKIILTIRDPEAWYNSIINTVASPELMAQQRSDPVSARLLPKLAIAYPRELGFAVKPPEISTREESIASFNQFNAQVQREIAPDRLLVYEVSQGWAPLCKFLGVALPTTPFPRENSTADFQQRAQMQPRES